MMHFTMRKEIRGILKSIVPPSVIKIRNQIKETRAIKRRKEKELADWVAAGRPAPPPHVIKQKVIKSYKDKYLYDVLVETGTYLGDMVNAQKKVFKKVISIELSAQLFENARQRFMKDKNVVLFQGDSGKVLHQILDNVNEPAIFWLDGHYSAGITALGDKECPIYEELEAIFQKCRNTPVILIDDARCFIGEGDYPTIEDLTAYVKSKDERYQVAIEYDIIRYTAS